MGGCCCCFLAHKPPRENPMHPAWEPLIRSVSSAAGHHHPVQMVTYSEGLGAAERLKAGFRMFKKTIYDKNPMLFGPLKSAQSPKYMVFACSDSRVCPSVTLDLKPGEAFPVRNIASLVLAYHQVKCIVVIGHSCCDGIRELLSLKEDRPHTYHFIDNWVKIGLAIKKKVEQEYALLSFEDQCTMLEIEAVDLSLRNLKIYPFDQGQIGQGNSQVDWCAL